MNKLILSAAGVSIVAMACHSANAAYCKSIGDDSQPSWADAPEWQQASAIAGVQFHLDNPEASDAAAHESWMAAKLADGWVFGETKDVEKKTHPCLVPFSDLPAAQQFKDVLFRAIVWGMAPNLHEIEAGMPPVVALQERAETAEAELNADNGQLVLVVEKVRELGLEPHVDDYPIGAVGAEVLGKLGARVDDLEAELKDATARADKAEGQLAAAAAAPKASAAPRGKKPRAIDAKAVKSPLVVTQDDEGTVSSVAAQLHELVQAAETVEVAFSNGKTELAEVPAVRIEGNAWKVTPVGLQLTIETLIVHGPAANAPAFELAGYGLILDGELVHYQPRGDVLQVTGGAQQNVAPDICFS